MSKWKKGDKVIVKTEDTEGKTGGNILCKPLQKYDRIHARVNKIRTDDWVYINNIREEEEEMRNIGIQSVHEDSLYHDNESDCQKCGSDSVYHDGKNRWVCPWCEL